MSPISINHWTFCVTRARLHVRFLKSAVESSGSFPARSELG